MDVETGTATPRSMVSSVLRFRDHTLIQDKPPELGGEDKGPMASELLLGALMSCQLSTYAKIATKRGITVGAGRLEGAVHFDDRGEIAGIGLDWHFHTECEGLETVLRLADKACTITKALRVPVEWRFHCEPSSDSVTPAAKASSR